MDPHANIFDQDGGFCPHAFVLQLKCVCVCTHRSMHAYTSYYEVLDVKAKTLH